MRHVIRRGGHGPARENDRTRVAALLATFLLLMAGVIVSAPGMISAGASGSTSVSNTHDEKNDDGKADDENDDENKDDDENDGDDGNHHDDECENEDQGHHEDDGDDEHEDDSSHSSNASTTTANQDTTHHDSHDTTHDDGHDDGDHDGDDDDDEDDDEGCTAVLTVVKFPDNQHGGNLAPENFQLLVDGQPQDQNVAATVSAGLHVVSEADVPGYKLSAISCTDDDTLQPVASDNGGVKLSADQHVTCTVVNDDIAPTITLHKEVQNNNGGSAVASDFHLTLDGSEVIQGAVVDVDANAPITVSESGTVAGYAPTSVVCTSDLSGSPNNLTVLDSGSLDVTPALAEHIECTITNHDTAPGLTVIKTVVTNNGGNEGVGDFPLQVNGDPVSSGTLVPFTAGVGLAITETEQPGYTATLMSCVSSDGVSANNFSTPTPDPAALGTVALAEGESVVCTITNDDIAPAVTVHKVVIGGPKVAADFQMTVGGINVDQDTAVPVLANTSVEVSEVAEPAYDKSSVVCTDTLTTQALVHPLVLDEGQSADCVVTNTFRAPATPTITVVKSVTNNSGGTLTKADFQLQIDGAAALQDTPIDVSPGPHTISEVAQPGYEQTSIVCVDSATQATVGQDGSVTLTPGQKVVCTVSNDDIAAALTVAKQLINNDGAVASPTDFQLKIDGLNVPQNQAQSVHAGLHTIGEVAVPGWRMTAINCTDDVAKVPVIYNAGITLALGQHVTCIVFNDDDPVDLLITKSDDGLVQVAGGAAFNYTITVDNLGPRDVTAGAAVTVTDQLPAGLHFAGTLPANCSAAAQTLTCSLLAADLQVADPAAVIVVSVGADADAASGTYTNAAFVDTAEDPACVGQCVPVCGASNNVDCENTDVTRESTVTIDKVRSVDQVGPGGTFSYSITVTNAGPSTFVPGLVMTDDLPAFLALVSVSADSPWTCNNTDPIVCTFGATAQPQTTTSAITVTVNVDPAFLGSSADNVASVTAVVEVGNVVTATDTESIPIVRSADLAIVKTASQTSTDAGGSFDWTLSITNHGPDTATNVVVSDAMPAQFAVTGTTPSGALNCTNTASTVQCTIAVLANGAGVQVVVHVTTSGAAVPGLVENAASVSAGSSDPVLANNTGAASIDISAVASSPPVPPAVSPAAPTPLLPSTGNGSLAGPLDLAGLLLVSGALVVVVARRRRPVVA